MKEIYRSPPWTSAGYRGFTVIYENGKQTTVYEHREVAEKMLDRKLQPGEVVHHKNRDTLDNRPENLLVCSSFRHGKLHAEEDRAPAEYVSLLCGYCGRAFIRLARYERHNRGMGKKGPFCSKSCSGKWSRQEQLEAGVNVGPRGSRPGSKVGRPPRISDETVAAARALYAEGGVSQAEVARRFGVDKSYMSLILRCKARNP